MLTARSGHAALKHRLEELGYEYEGEELDRLYTAFLDVADKKKEVYDEDLEALVNERDREECAIYTLEGVQVSCGFPLKPTATVTLRGPEGDVRTVCDWGAGPIDAVYKAIDQIVQVDNDLSEFAVNAVTRGIDALGEVTVRVKAAGGEVYVGRGADGDIIVSSAKAYLNALNPTAGREALKEASSLRALPKSVSGVTFTEADGTSHRLLYFPFPSSSKIV